MSPKKGTGRMIALCASVIQQELGEGVILHPVVKESLAFFLRLPTEIKMGYIDHLMKLAANHLAHISRVFQILMMINASWEV